MDFENNLTALQDYEETFQKWIQSAELQAKELQKTVKNTLQNFADNPTAVQEFGKEPVVAFNIRDAKKLSPQRHEIIKHLNLEHYSITTW